MIVKSFDEQFKLGFGDLLFSQLTMSKLLFYFFSVVCRAHEQTIRVNTELVWYFCLKFIDSSLIIILLLLQFLGVFRSCYEIYFLLKVADIFILITRPNICQIIYFLATLYKIEGL